MNTKYRLTQQIVSILLRTIGRRKNGLTQTQLQPTVHLGRQYPIHHLRAVKRLRTPRLSMLWRVMLYTLSLPTPIMNPQP